MTPFDIVILVIIALGGITGFRSGLIIGMARLIGKVAAIGIAIVFHQQFLHIIDPIFGLRETLEPKLNNFLGSMINNQVPTGSSAGVAGSVIQPVIGEASFALTDYVLNIASMVILFIVAAFLINILISIIIAPIAKTLSIVDRSGGMAFGLLSSFVGLSIVIGVLAPFLTSSETTNFLQISDSYFYPWMIEGYDFMLAVLKSITGDILENPIQSFRLWNEQAQI